MFMHIAEELNLQTHQVRNTVELLDADNTVPFIARYRKEMTGSLDEENIRAIGERIRYMRHLEERKQTVLKSIREQGKLTPELEEKITAATRLQEVEDFYLPYKPKKRTGAIIAKENGLEPLARLILEQEIVEGDPMDFAVEYINEEKGVHSAEEALAGARDIVAEVVADDAEIRKIIREDTMKTGMLYSEAIQGADVAEFEMYKEFSEPVKKIPPHRILAINRGERENVLRVSVEVAETEMVAKIRGVHITNEKSIFTEELQKAVNDD